MTAGAAAAGKACDMRRQVTGALAARGHARPAGGRLRRQRQARLGTSDRGGLPGCPAPGPHARGRPNTNSVRPRLAGADVRRPRAGAITRPANPAAALVRVHPGELTGQVELIAEYRDGSPSVSHGLCTPLWVIPATWRVRMPEGILSVANRDPAGHDKLVPSGGLVTCRGQIGGYDPVTVAPPGP